MWFYVLIEIVPSIVEKLLVPLLAKLGNFVPAFRPENFIPGFRRTAAGP